MLVQFQCDFDFQNRALHPLAKYFESKGHEVTWELDREADIGIYGSPGTQQNAKKKFNINHGIGNKGWHWCQSPVNDMYKKEKGCVHLVPNQMVCDYLRSLGLEAHVTGIPYLDRAFKEPQIHKSGVFYASSCQPELNSSFYIGPRVLDLGEVTVSIHPAVYYNIPETVRKLWPFRFEDIASIGIAQNGIVIADYASCALESLIINRPVIVFEMGAYKNSEYFLPTSLEWRYRDCYYKAESYQDVVDYVKMLRELGIDEDDPLKLLRTRASQELLEYRGCASERAYDVIMGCV